MKKIILITILSILISIYISTEVLILENGKIIDGKIIKMDEDTMTVITKTEELIIDRDKIIQTFRSMDDYNNYKRSLEKNSKEPEKGNLIAEWLFNGNADDTSGNGLNGKIFGSKALVEDRFGNKNSAFEFGTGKTKLIKIDKNINVFNQDNFSISVWVKIKNPTRAARIFDLYVWRVRKGYQITCGSEGHVGFWSWFSDSTQNGVGTNKILEKDVWNNVIIICNNKKHQVFLNGNLENEQKITGDIIFPNSSEANLYFGAAGENDNYAYQFVGCIDDIRFYNYALSEEEIDTLYHENGWGR